MDIHCCGMLPNYPYYPLRARNGQGTTGSARDRTHVRDHEWKVWKRERKREILNSFRSSKSLPVQIVIILIMNMISTIIIIDTNIIFTIIIIIINDYKFYSTTLLMIYISNTCYNLLYNHWDTAFYFYNYIE